MNLSFICFLSDFLLIPIDHFFYYVKVRASNISMTWFPFVLDQLTKLDF